MTPWTESGAQFSPCGLYRYTLWRVRPEGAGTCAFIMLNPSTADVEKDDPTVARCWRFAAGWGYRRLEVRNIFAYRTPYPQQLKLARDPVGADNDDAILTAALQAKLVVCAWGAHGQWMGRGARVRRMLDEVGVRPHYLKLTQSGEPGHPLYLRSLTTPKPFLRAP